MFMLVGVLFLSGADVIGCAISSRCGGGGSIACTGEICIGGSGWIECYDSDGNVTRAQCSQQ